MSQSEYLMLWPGQRSAHTLCPVGTKSCTPKGANMSQTDPSWILFSPAGARTVAMDDIKRQSQRRRREPQRRRWTRLLAVLGRRGRHSRRARPVRPKVI